MFLIFFVGFVHSRIVKCPHKMKDIQVRILAEIIFFAINYIFIFSGF